MVESLEDAPRVFIVADRELSRTELRRHLEEQGATVVGETADGEEAVWSVAKLIPNVVVIDVPKVVDATRQIVAMVPLSRVLVLAADQDDELDSRLAGASGSLPRNSSAQELMAAIQAASVRPRSIPPEVAARILQLLEPSQRESRPLQRAGSRIRAAVAKLGIGKPRVVMRLKAQESLNSPIGVAELAFTLAAIALVFMVVRGLITG